MLYSLCNAIANIKSGLKTKKLSVGCRPNNFLKRVLRKLIFEGYIRGFSEDPLKVNFLRIHLKYDENMTPVIRDIKIISTSGHRVYYSYRKVLEAHYRGDNLLLSTTQGLFTVNEIIFNNFKIGGEVILKVSLY